MLSAKSSLRLVFSALVLVLTLVSAPLSASASGANPASPAVVPLLVSGSNGLRIGSSYQNTLYYVDLYATQSYAALYELSSGNSTPTLLEKIPNSSSTPTALVASATDVYLLTQDYSATNSGSIIDYNLSAKKTTRVSSPLLYGAASLALTPTTLYALNPFGGPNLSGSLVALDLASNTITEIDSALLATPSAFTLLGSVLYILNPTPFGAPSLSSSVVTYDTSSDSFSTISDPSHLLVGVTHLVATASDLWLFSPATASAPSILYDYSPVTSSITSHTLPSVPDASYLTPVGPAANPTSLWLSQDTAGPFYDGQIDIFNLSTYQVTTFSSPDFMYPGSVLVTNARAYVISNPANDPTTYPTPSSAQSPANGSIIAAVSLNQYAPAYTSPHYTRGILPPKDPRANLPLVPYVNATTCVYTPDSVYANTPECLAQQIQALDIAHQTEHLPPFVLPTNWSRLTVPQQLFVAFNIERVDRRIPPYLGINSALSVAATVAARKNSDPTIVTRGFPLAPYGRLGAAIGGVWAGDFSPLSALFGFMYADGWAGSSSATSNFSCTSALAPGCWGHRDEILGEALRSNATTGLTCTTCEAGVGYAIRPNQYRWGSYVGLFERPVANPPAMTFTWAKNVLPYWHQ